ncbi:hypothetical protein ACFSJQ_02010 [Vibrio olivae]
MNIRPATADDAGTIFGFIKELAEYEQALECVEASQQDIIDSLFTEQATAKALICEHNGQAIGYAVYFQLFYLAWEKWSLFGRPLCYSCPSWSGGGQKPHAVSR